MTRRFKHAETLPAMQELLERARASADAAKRDLDAFLDAMLETAPIRVGDVVKRHGRIYLVDEVRLDHLPKPGEPFPYRYLCRTFEVGRGWTGARLILPADVELVPEHTPPLTD